MRCPDLENWVSGVRSQSLRTVRDTDIFPSPVAFQLSTLTLAARRLPPPVGAEPNPISAELGVWRFSFEADETTLAQMVNAQSVAVKYLQPVSALGLAAPPNPADDPGAAPDPDPKTHPTIPAPVAS